MPGVDHKYQQVAKVLASLVDSGNNYTLKSQSRTPFHSSGVPQISIEIYFILVAMNSALQPEQATSVLILIERICNLSFAKG